MDWRELNRRLRTAAEEWCAEQLAVELAGPARRAFLLRIHARLNRLRARRERAELEQRSIAR